MLRFSRKTYRAFTLLKSLENSRAISVANYKLSGWDQVPFKLDVTCLFDKKEGLPGVLGNKGTWPFTFGEQGIS